MARRRDVRAVADTRCHAANAGAAGSCAVAGGVFCRRFGFQAARFDVLVSRCRQRADAGDVRRQPVCQANRDRTSCPTATPKPAARGRAPYAAGNADLVRLFCVQRRHGGFAGMERAAWLVGGLHGDCVVYPDGRAVRGGVGLPQAGVEGLR